jgi:hypothetical protein
LFSLSSLRENSRSSQFARFTFSHGENVDKCVGLHFRLFFHKLIWPRLKSSFPLSFGFSSSLRIFRFSVHTVRVTVPRASQVSRVSSGSEIQRNRPWDDVIVKNRLSAVEDR